MKSQQRRWAIVIGLVLFASACGSSASDEAATGVGEENADPAESESAPEGADDELVYVSPIGEFLGWSADVDFDEEAERARFDALERQVQEDIAACMAAEGFEYIPIDVAAQQAFFDEQLEGDEAWGSAEWTAKYGFGISTQRFSQAQVGPDLVGHNYLTFEDEGPPDPNREYVESLSPGESEAYYAALYGEDSFEVFEEPIWVVEDREPTDEEIEAYEAEMMAMEQDYTPTGCEPVAYEEAYGGEFGPEGDAELFEAFDQEFGDYWMELEQRFESHPDVIAYEDGVRECIEAKGLTYLSEEDAWEYYEAELEAAGLGWEAMGDPLDGVDTTGFTDEDYERAYREFETQLLPADMLAALADVQADEIATALAVNECGGGWEQRERALQDVRVELEEAFLVENADALAQYEGVFGE